MGAGVLLFLNSVESLRLLKIAGARPRVLGSYRVSRPRALMLRSRLVHVSSGSSVVQVRDQGGARWTRFTAPVAVPQRQARFNKATGPTTDLSVAVAADGGAGRFFAGLPLRVPSRLPVSVNAQFDPDTARVTLQESDWNQWLLRRIAELIESIARHELQHRPAGSWRWILLISGAGLTFLDPRRSFDATERQAIWATSGGRCGMCQEPVDTWDAEFDHVVPWIRGGRTTVDNGRAVHRTCNRRRGEGDEEDAA